MLLTEKPIDIVAIDYETKDSKGASFQSFRSDFSVFSLSCAWRNPTTGQIETWFSTSPYQIKFKLQELAANRVKVLAHNLPYEMQVTTKCYPEIDINWHACTMRLSQVRDAGGAEYSEMPALTLEQELSLELGEITEKEIKSSLAKTKGLSLEACSARFLPAEYHNHKAEAHNYLIENHKIKPNHAGRNLHLLPYEILARYNAGDVINTLLLYEEQIKYFTEIKYDWQPDHRLYFDRARLINGAYNRGIRIDRAKLYQYIIKLEKDIDNIEINFLNDQKDSIKQVIEYKKENFLAKYLAEGAVKTAKGRLRRQQKVETALHTLEENWNKFNLGSAVDLRILFCEIYKMTPKFLTPKGSPSFKSSHLNQWGAGGEKLLLRKKLMLVLQQAANTWLASQYDGHAHPNVRTAGTRTNRVASGTNL